LLLAWFKQHFLGKQLIRVFLWTLMLWCAIKMHFLIKHIKTLYTNDTLRIIKQCEHYSKQFPPKVFKSFDALKDFSLDKPHLYLWPNTQQSIFFWLWRVITHYHTRKQFPPMDCSKTPSASFKNPSFRFKGSLTHECLVMSAST
jgi:hypothetical protein